MDYEEKAAGQEVDQSTPVATAAENGTGKAPDNESSSSQKKATGLEALRPGTRCKGKVRNIVDFGAFIDIGVGRDGLAHVSTLKRAGLDKTLKVGDVIDVVVRRVDTDNNRISLTLPRGDREDRTALNKLEPGAQVTGKVMRLVDFGAFVDIGAQADGLVHVSQLSNGFVKHPSEVVKVGDEVSLRILEVDRERRRISLTMKDAEEEAPKDAPAAVQPQVDEDWEGPTAFELAFKEAMNRKKRRR